MKKKSKNGKNQGEPMPKCFSAARLGLYLLKERVYYGMLPYLVILKILVVIFLYFILKNSKIRQMFFFFSNFFLNDSKYFFVSGLRVFSGVKFQAREST